MQDEAVSYVVINADDLGLHPAVLRAVLQGHREGTLRSASLLTNSPFTAEAAESARRVEGLSIGVHLNIVRGRPLLPPEQVGSLVGRDGHFLADTRRFAWRYLRGAIRAAEVEREWAAQVERALALGIRPTHLDSEKHVHCLPGFFETACGLALRYGIPWVRRIRERVSWTRWDAAALRGRLLNWSQRISQAGVRVDRLHFVDEVWGVSHGGDRLDLGRFIADCGRRRAPRLTEVICHPGAPLPDDPPLTEVGRLRVPRHWERELEALTGEAARRLREDPRFSLVGFGRVEIDLPGGKRWPIGLP
jgi:predicted glycoside hydrolase/deacetylase ChbG (UPF0249 family)